MPLIQLQTLIHAPRERVFDLACSIDLHQHSMHHTGERAVAGVTSGLIGLGGEVIWEARHFGVKQRLRVRITKFDRPRHFQDEMMEGAFHHMRHDHLFEERGETTVMTDCFEFASPFGILGRCGDRLFLTGYMRRLLELRNAVLKRLAESEEWRRYLESS